MRGAVNLLARHWLFSVALGLGLLLRLFTMLGFPPAIWFGGDSVSYVNSGLHWWPGVSRESGYGVMLGLLHPFHSFVVVTAIQHLMGLAMGVLVYALLRSRYRLPAWGATLAAAPVLLDVYMIQLEQEILADSAFTFLCVAAITLVLWWPDDRRPAWSLPAAAALLAIASTFWPPGLPLLILLLIYMIVRRFGWRPVVATAVGGAIPLALYLGWFDVRYHQVAFNDSNGVFLWSRTMTFADCSVIKPPADLRPLCPTGSPATRQSAPFYIWEGNSPLLKVGTGGSNKFSKSRNDLAQKFAIKAIEAQPLSYANVVFRGWLMNFDWNRPNVPSVAMADRYQFTNATQTQNALSGTSTAATRAGVAALHKVQRAYTGGSTADTREVQPFADVMIDYQKVMYVRGTMIGALLLIGLGGIILAWRRGGFLKPLRGGSRGVVPPGRYGGWGGPCLYPFLAVLVIEITPQLTANFSNRYVVPTIPVACLAAALAFARPLPRPAEAAPSTGSADGAAVASPQAGGSLPESTSPELAGLGQAENTDQGGNSPS
jgi:hypothetical protein